MNLTYDPQEKKRVELARESFSGRLLTDKQFDEGMMITNIIEQEILKSGLFKEKLQDFSFAYARTEKFDQMKAETIIRDLFKARTGQTMNQMRENLKASENALTPQQKMEAAVYVQAIEPMVRDGNKISFRRALAHQASKMASAFNITENGATRQMSECTKVSFDKDLFEWGKEPDTQYYRPQIEAEKQRNQRPRQQSLSLSR